jgi:hypothetical protein
MKIRALLLAFACVRAGAGMVQAQPGTAFLQGRGGAMIPVGTFHHDQNPGAAYSIAAGYEFVDFFDMVLEFTHTLNDTDDFVARGPNFTAFSDEVAQTFIVDIGPRINFVPSDFPVRPYGLFQAGWYHFAHFNNIEVDGRTLLSDDDDDQVGIEAGLGLEGTIFQLYERPGDDIPVFELTVGAQGSYHHTVDQGPDEQFVTAMGSLGLRF